MDSNILAVLIPTLGTVVGTVIGTFGGIRQANKLTMYRIEQLEQKVDKHNNLIERAHNLEKNAALLDEKISVANHRLDDLEKKVG